MSPTLRSTLKDCPHTFESIPTPLFIINDITIMLSFILYNLFEAHPSNLLEMRILVITQNVCNIWEISPINHNLFIYSSLLQRSFVKGSNYCEIISTPCLADIILNDSGNIYWQFYYCEIIGTLCLADLILNDSGNIYAQSNYCEIISTPCLADIILNDSGNIHWQIYYCVH